MYFGSEFLLQAVLRTATGRAITAVVCVAGSTALVYFAVPDGVDKFALWGDHAPVRAKVVDTRELRDTEGVPHYSVRYAFERDGRTYGFRRRFGTEWQDVSDAEYERVSMGEPIDVIYHPPRPAINDLAGHAGGLLGWAVGLTVTPVLLAAASVGWMVRMIAGTLSRRLFAPTTTDGLR